MISYLKKKIKRKVTFQLVLFLIVAFFGTVLNYLIFVFMYKLLFINYLLSIIMGYFFGVNFAFFMNKKYTFDSQEKLKKSLGVYLFINLSALIISLIIMYIFVEIFKTNIPFTYFMILSSITFLKFFLSKIFAFKNKEW